MRAFNHGVVASTTFQMPLSKIINCNSDDTILVTDSVNCDGRFVLYTIAAAILNNNSFGVGAVADRHNKSNESCKSGVLWIGCTATSNEAILNSMKKIGCDKHVVLSAAQIGQVAHPSNTLYNHTKRLSILSITDAARNMIDQKSRFDEVDFVRGIYRQIKDLVSEKLSQSFDLLCIVLDDVTSLEALVGERLAYGLIYSLHSLQSIVDLPLSIVMRSSNDCAESGIDYGNTTAETWVRGLIEFADTVIDVTPLSSGYSRDVHGRLTFSTRSLESNPILYNYRLADSQVIVMQVAPHRQSGH